MATPSPASRFPHGVEETAVYRTLFAAYPDALVVEIALSPLQDQGLPLVVAAIRDIGAYPRMKRALQRARSSEQLATLGRIAVDARDPQVLLNQVPVVADDALEAEVAMVYLLESNLRDLRVASAVGSVPGEGLGELVANRSDTCLLYTSP